MKKSILDISDKLRNGEITEKQAQKQGDIYVYLP